MLGTQEAYDFYIDLNAELKQKIAEKKGVAENEKVQASLGRRTSLLVCPGRFPVF